MIQIPDITAKTKESETQYETKNKTWSKLAGELLRVHIEIIVNSDKKFVATVASYCEILKKVLFNKSHLNCLVKMSLLFVFLNSLKEDMFSLEFVVSSVFFL